MSAVTKDFATEAGHFYDKDGTPRYTYTNAKGGTSNTTVREARKNGWYPSVTQILRQAAAPGLERWKIGNAIMSALTLARQEGESDEDYIARILRDSNEQAAKARDRGTEIHGAIERLYRGDEFRSEFDGALYDFSTAAFRAVDEWAMSQDWATERSFASPLGFGGKLDLSAPGYVVDFKTTDKDLAGLKLWPDHRRQLAAYRHGLGMESARCAICYVSSVKPEARLIELTEEELQQGWREFLALLEFYRAMNKI